MTKKQPLTQTRIFWFWLPLAAMWLMMAIEHPAIAAVIARLPAPAPNLTAVGVTFSLALIVESPIIMLLTAGTALARGKQSYERLLNFTHILSATLMTLHVVIALTPLFGFIVGGLIGAPTEIVEPSRQAFLLMTPWTPAIAYRRLWQGVLIRFDRTWVVPLTIAARVVAGGLVLASLLPDTFRPALAKRLHRQAARLISVRWLRYATLLSPSRYPSAGSGRRSIGARSSSSGIEKLNGCTGCIPNDGTSRLRRYCSEKSIFNSTHMGR